MRSACTLVDPLRAPVCLPASRTPTNPTTTRAATGLDALRGIQSKELRRQAAKQQLATAAQQLLQDPEKQLPQLRALLELLRDEDAQVRPAGRQRRCRSHACSTCGCANLLCSPARPACVRLFPVGRNDMNTSKPVPRPPAALQVCRLAMLTLLAVFRDLIPAYRIRPVHEEEAPEQVRSKPLHSQGSHHMAACSCPLPSAMGRRRRPHRRPRLCPCPLPPPARAAAVQGGAGAARI